MKKQPESYGEAIAEVEKIVAGFSAGTLDVDTLAAEVKRATELIRWCKQRLAKAEKDVSEALGGGEAADAETDGGVDGGAGGAPRGL